jgi:hypothetical protein
VISANSAGAYALCPDCLKIKEGYAGIIPAIGLVDFCVKAHYEPKFDSALQDLSRDRKIYGLGNCSAVILNGEDKEFIGEVYLFSNKQKQQVN